MRASRIKLGNVGSYTFLDSPNFVLVKKLKCLKDDLRKRYKEVIGQLDLPKARALSDIQIQGCTCLI